MSHTLADTVPDAMEYRSILRKSFLDSYEDESDVWTDEKAMRFAVPVLLEYLEGHRHVLDVGAGRGNDTLMLLKSGYEVTAIDLVEAKEWELIRKSYKSSVRFETLALEELQEPERFDAVLDNGCFHHQHPNSYLDYLNHLSYLCVKGGYLVINLFTPNVSDEIKKGRLWEKHDGRLTRDFILPEAIDMLKISQWIFVKSVPIFRPGCTHDYLMIVAKNNRGM